MATSESLAALMFTDIVGSAALEQSEEVTERISELVRGRVGEHGGNFVRQGDDETFSTFPTALGAVSCAVAIQQVLRGEASLVLTLGEKMSSVKMNAAHGTATQLTAIACIALADTSAVPVSTTHVVASGVAGSMRASGAGLQFSTIRGIVITWFTTLPGCFVLSFAFSIMLHAAVT